MEIDKEKVLEMLRARGLVDRAAFVDRQLPARIDVEKNSGLLATLNIDPADCLDDAPAQS